MPILHHSQVAPLDVSDYDFVAFVLHLLLVDHEVSLRRNLRMLVLQTGFDCCKLLVQVQDRPVSLSIHVDLNLH